MASRARNELATRLLDVDELIHAHAKLTGGTKGRPKQRQGAAVTRAGVVLLAAATEAFAEDLFEEAAELMYPSASKRRLGGLFDKTTRRLHTANVANVDALFFSLGLPWVLDSISWQKFPNAVFKRSLNDLILARNKIAHGEQPGVRLQQLWRWRRMVEHYSKRLEDIVSVHIADVTGSTVPW